MDFHVVERMDVDLVFLDPRLRPQDEATLATWIRSECMAALEESFDNFPESDRTIVLDNIDLDLGRFGSDEYRTALPERMKRELTRQILSLIADSKESSLAEPLEDRSGPWLLAEPRRILDSRESDLLASTWAASPILAKLVVVALDSMIHRDSLTGDAKIRFWRGVFESIESKKGRTLPPPTAEESHALWEHFSSVSSFEWDKFVDAYEQLVRHRQASIPGSAKFENLPQVLEQHGIGIDSSTIPTSSTKPPSRSEETTRNDKDNGTPNYESRLGQQRQGEIVTGKESPTTTPILIEETEIPARTTPDSDHNAETVAPSSATETNSVEYKAEPPEPPASRVAKKPSKSSTSSKRKSKPTQTASTNSDQSDFTQPKETPATRQSFQFVDKESSAPEEIRDPEVLLNPNRPDIGKDASILNRWPKSPELDVSGTPKIDPSIASENGRVVQVPSDAFPSGLPSGPPSSASIRAHLPDSLELLDPTLAMPSRDADRKTYQLSTSDDTKTYFGNRSQGSIVNCEFATHDAERKAANTAPSTVREAVSLGIILPEPGKRNAPISDPHLGNPAVGIPETSMSLRHPSVQAGQTKTFDGSSSEELVAPLHPSSREKEPCSPVHPALPVANPDALPLFPPSPGLDEHGNGSSQLHSANHAESPLLHAPSLTSHPGSLFPHPSTSISPEDEHVVKHPGAALDLDSTASGNRLSEPPSELCQNATDPSNQASFDRIQTAETNPGHLDSPIISQDVSEATPRSTIRYGVPQDPASGQGSLEADSLPNSGSSWTTSPADSHDVAASGTTPPSQRAPSIGVPGAKASTSQDAKPLPGDSRFETRQLDASRSSLSGEGRNPSSHPESRFPIRAAATQPSARTERVGSDRESKATESITIDNKGVDDKKRLLPDDSSSESKNFAHPVPGPSHSEKDSKNEPAGFILPTDLDSLRSTPSVAPGSTGFDPPGQSTENPQPAFQTDPDVLREASRTNPLPTTIAKEEGSLTGDNVPGSQRTAGAASEHQRQSDIASRTRGAVEFVAVNSYPRGQTNAPPTWPESVIADKIDSAPPAMETQPAGIPYPIKRGELHQVRDEILDAPSIMDSGSKARGFQAPLVSTNLESDPIASELDATPSEGPLKSTSDQFPREYEATENCRESVGIESRDPRARARSNNSPLSSNTEQHAIPSHGHFVPSNSLPVEAGSFSDQPSPIPEEISSAKPSTTPDPGLPSPLPAGFTKESLPLHQGSSVANAADSWPNGLPAESSLFGNLADRISSRRTSNESGSEENSASLTDQAASSVPASATEIGSEQRCGLEKLSAVQSTPNTFDQTFSGSAADGSAPLPQGKLDPDRDAPRPGDVVRKVFVRTDSETMPDEASHIASSTRNRNAFDSANESSPLADARPPHGEQVAPSRSTESFAARSESTSGPEPSGPDDAEDGLRNRLDTLLLRFPPSTRKIVSKSIEIHSRQASERGRFLELVCSTLERNAPLDLESLVILSGSLPPSNQERGTERMPPHVSPDDPNGAMDRSSRHELPSAPPRSLDTATNMTGFVPPAANHPASPDPAVPPDSLQEAMAAQVSAQTENPPRSHLGDGDYPKTEGSAVQERTTEGNTTDFDRRLDSAAPTNTPIPNKSIPSPEQTQASRNDVTLRPGSGHFGDSTNITPPPAVAAKPHVHQMDEAPNLGSRPSPITEYSPQELQSESSKTPAHRTTSLQSPDEGMPSHRIPVGQSNPPPQPHFPLGTPDGGTDQSRGTPKSSDAAHTQQMVDATAAKLPSILPIASERPITQESESSEPQESRKDNSRSTGQDHASSQGLESDATASSESFRGSTVALNRPKTTDPGSSPISIPEWNSGPTGSTETIPASLAEFTPWLSRIPATRRQDLVTSLNTSLEKAANPHRFRQLVLAAFESGTALDLEEFEHRSSNPLDPIQANLVSDPDPIQYRPEHPRPSDSRSVEPERSERHPIASHPNRPGSDQVEVLLGDLLDFLPPQNRSILLDSIRRHMKKSKDTNQFLQAVREVLARRAPLDLEAILETCATTTAPTLRAPNSPDFAAMSMENLEYAIQQAHPKEAPSALLCADMVTEIVTRFGPAAMRNSLAKSSRETTYRFLVHEERPFTPRKLSEALLLNFQAQLPHLEPRSVATMIQRRLALPPFAPPPKSTQGSTGLSYANSRSVATPEGAPVRHAGLVLTAPYLPRLFAMLGLVDRNAFTSEDHTSRALRLLHYLAAGHDEAGSHDFSLEKVLCGASSDFPNPDGIRLEPNEKTTCDQLLGGIIQNWKAIGNTSAQGLRETFLLRDGALRLQDEFWHLVVPSKAFDVLVDRIPWGFSTIRFPWMEFPLQTKWREA